MSQKRVKPTSKWPPHLSPSGISISVQFSNASTSSSKFSDKHFKIRSEEKNALAISSDQSKYIDSYESVINGYKESLEFGNLKECPDFWGGYSFTPYYFEFWEGHSSRLNKRDAFKKDGNFWHHSILQP